MYVCMYVYIYIWIGFRENLQETMAFTCFYHPILRVRCPSNLSGQIARSDQSSLRPALPCGSSSASRIWKFNLPRLQKLLFEELQLIASIPNLGDLLSPWVIDFILMSLWFHGNPDKSKQPYEVPKWLGWTMSHPQPGTLCDRMTGQFLSSRTNGAPLPTFKWPRATCARLWSGPFGCPIILEPLGWVMVSQKKRYTVPQIKTRPISQRISGSTHPYLGDFGRVAIWLPPSGRQKSDSQNHWLPICIYIYIHI